MNKEELKEEVEEKASIYFDSLEVDNGNVSDTPFSAYDVFVAYEKGALEFAEPREKRIAELEETINKLREQFALRYDLEDKIKELEQQIEEMKCCYNCRHSRTEYEHCRTDKHEKWEIKER